jgi:ABC-type branched-subunit amino acid transport system substrate-binding protein
MRSLATAGLAVATTATVAVGVIAAGAGVAGAKPKGTPYYIAAELSLSGAFSSFEIPMLQGLEVAVETINASGGILGHPVALDYQSDDSSTTKVTPALESIFAATKAKRIVFMLPNVLTPVVDTVLQYTQQYGIASFDPGSGGDVFTASKHPYNYSIYPATTLQIAPSIAAMAKEVGGVKTIKLGMLNGTDSGDVALATVIVKGVKAAGGQVVGQETVAPTSTDVSVQLSALEADHANVVMVETSGSPAIAAASGLQQLAWKTVKMIIDPANVNAKIQAGIPTTVRSQIVTLGEQIYLQGTTGGPLAKYKKFAKALSKTTGGIDDLEISANISDSAVLDAWAINKAKSTTIKKVAKVLNSIGKYKLPKTLLVWMPNPKWTTTNHTFSNATMATGYWALITAGTEKTGTLPGQKLTITKTLIKVATQVGPSSTSK